MLVRFNKDLDLTGRPGRRYQDLTCVAIFTLHTLL